MMDTGIAIQAVIAGGAVAGVIAPFAGWALRLAFSLQKRVLALEFAQQNDDRQQLNILDAVKRIGEEAALHAATHREDWLRVEGRVNDIAAQLASLNGRLEGRKREE